ncbi:hypothetical protein SAMN05216474_3074 [Lishizhenia tianjinensis]|uniref:Uncharacterized protein n=1 Tax=Lishizhenia tianjinensis TaxID=477690 RepID=A0A1I7BU20_9FLAO|nr:hypothetical protein [Lishizhenia tianjinensis]SFT90633.1 hypothetical protein SAMN05216474_3074 [Lishizhenia tianjinensis]
MKKRHEQKFVVLSIVALLAFNVPFVLMFDSNEAVGGIPVLYLYIFSVWLLIVLFAYRILSKFYE